jgi:hypothetical protein
MELPAFEFANADTLVRLIRDGDAQGIRRVLLGGSRHQLVRVEDYDNEEDDGYEAYETALMYAFEPETHVHWRRVTNSDDAARMRCEAVTNALLLPDQQQEEDGSRLCLRVMVRWCNDDDALLTAAGKRFKAVVDTRTDLVHHVVRLLSCRTLTPYCRSSSEHFFRLLSAGGIRPGWQTLMHVVIYRRNSHVLDVEPQVRDLIVRHSTAAGQCRAFVELCALHLNRCACMHTVDMARVRTLFDVEALLRQRDPTTVLHAVAQRLQTAFHLSKLCQEFMMTTTPGLPWFVRDKQGRLPLDVAGRKTVRILMLQQMRREALAEWPRVAMLLRAHRRASSLGWMPADVFRRVLEDAIPSAAVKKNG